jgi:hypothetical protein
LLFRYRADNFVSDPTKGGTEPTRELRPREREVRPVRVDRLTGREPVKRLMLRSRNDNFVRDPI